MIVQLIILMSRQRTAEEKKNRRHVPRALPCSGCMGERDLIVFPIESVCLWDLFSMGPCLPPSALLSTGTHMYTNMPARWRRGGGGAMPGTVEPTTRKICVSCFIFPHHPCTAKRRRQPFCGFDDCQLIGAHQNDEAGVLFLLL